MKVKVYYKTGINEGFQQVKKTETTDDENILYIEKHISRYYNKGEKI